MINYELFKNPPQEYRGVPFWSINDHLNPEEVARQITLLDYGGYGGAFFHAREGLVTPFLGDEWFKSFEAALNEAEKHGMFIWIYDELWWPSGFAGGIIPSLGPKYRAKALVAILGERAYSGSEIVATFKCKLSNEGLPCEYMPARPGEEGGGYIYLSFMTYTASLGETWFSGMSYVDLLSAEVVRKFIEVAYAPYVERFREKIGKRIPGVFTDEPNISSSRPRMFGFGEAAPVPPRGPRFPIFAFPWTEEIIERFKRMNGYNILDRLPELLFEVGNYMKTRHDFWKTVTVLFLESFSKQIYEWCEKNGLKFTGHYLSEDNLLSQLICGGAVMPHYEYQHIPGIDHLGMHVWGSLLTAKQVSSVANQLGKERVLCETYGCTGNYPSFADRKWIGDWLYAMGINLLNHHLVPYSMRGRRKRDYGLNFHWSQPWWNYNRIIEDYFARLSYALSIGRRVVNVLVIHPISSAWAVFSPLNVSKVRDLNDALMALLRTLLSLHIDFDLGDETIIAKYGSVKSGKFLVGKMSYDAIIVPASLTLEENTVKLLKEFVEGGGKIVVVLPKPFLIGGEKSEKIVEVLNKAVSIERIDKASINSALKDVYKTIMVEGDEEGDVLYHLRLDEESGVFILFLSNTSKENAHSLRLSMNGSFKVELWDVISGEKIDYPAEVSCGRTIWHIKLDPINSALFILSPGVPTSKKAVERWIKIREETINGAWKVRRMNPNILVLDYCRYRIKGAWSELMPVWRAHNLIVRNGLGSRFLLRFEFESDIDFKDRKLYLVVERPERFKIHVNGLKVDVKTSGYWIDWNFPMIDISEMVGRGLNTIELEGLVELEPELENIYLLGEFGVKAGAKGSSRIIEEPRLVDLGDLCQMGYPFYAGEIELSKNINLYAPENAKIILQIEGLNSSLAMVYVNGKEAGKIIFPNYEVDVTSLLKPGENEIKVLLVGTLRNALGPLHYKGGDPAYISPESFKDQANWVDEYVLKPFSIRSIKILVFKGFHEGEKNQ